MKHHSVGFLVLLTNFVGILEGWTKRRKNKSIVEDFNDLLCKLNDVHISDFVRKYMKTIIFITVLFSIEFIIRLFHPHAAAQTFASCFVILIGTAL